MHTFIAFDIGIRHHQMINCYCALLLVAKQGMSLVMYGVVTFVSFDFLTLFELLFSQLLSLLYALHCIFAAIAASATTSL